MKKTGYEIMLEACEQHALYLAKQTKRFRKNKISFGELSAAREALAQSLVRLVTIENGDDILEDESEEENNEL